MASLIEVEVFESVEIGGDGARDFDTPEAVEAFRSRCERLGLKGQAALVTSPAASESATVFPFRAATSEEVFVYSTLFPTVTTVESFRTEAIPSRVIDVLERAQGTGRFKCFEVWSSPDPSAKDPVLVGYFPTPGYPTLKQEPHLIARWGSALAPFSDLIRAALTRFRATRLAALKRIAKEVEIDLAFVESIDPSLGVTPERTGTPYYSGHFG